MKSFGELHQFFINTVIATARWTFSHSANPPIPYPFIHPDNYSLGKSEVQTGELDNLFSSSVKLLAIYFSGKNNESKAKSM